MKNFLLHKPFGYLSQFTNNGPKKGRKKLLGELYNFPEGTMAIGRLDEPSEGLLLLTTDGKESEKIRSHKVEKEYYVQVDGLVSAKAVKALTKGVTISVNGKQYLTKPCKVAKISDPGFPPRIQKIRDERHGPTSWVSITLTEGKFRQVRKMTAAVGFPTLRLVRWRIGQLVLGSLEPGKVIKVDDLKLNSERWWQKNIESKPY